MRHRMAIAVFALLGLLVSAYLLLFKLGITGALACGPGGGCERVQTSRYAELLGLPVAAYGVAGYVVLLAVAVAGLQERWIDRPEPTRWLVALSGAGVLFSIYLTAVEFFVIRAVCRWCVASAVLITAIFAASLAGLRRTTPAPAR